MTAAAAPPDSAPAAAPPAAARPPLLVLDGVTRRYDGRAVVDRVSLAVADGEFVTFLGPSGCGKTTLLRLVAGFDQPDEGRVLLDGRDLTADPPHRRPVNTVFQSYALFPHMTVAQNVAYGLRMEGRPRGEIAARVADALAMVRMTGFEGRRPDQLSGGQQQRVAIARAVVKRPRVLLLDEPLSALDAKLRREMQGELKRIQRDLGITFVFVTHDQEEALSMSDRVVVMNEGRVAQHGTPREVYETPATLFVARFVGGTNLFRGRVVRVIDEGARMECEVEGMAMTLRRARTDLAEGDAIDVLLRPEDLRVLPADAGRGFAGRIVERSYKGMTLDSVIRLEGGAELHASEFFDETAPGFDHRPGEAVRVTWVPDWEWVLPAAGEGER